ncbi:P43 5S RNA-binding protein [Alosa sapidissima]|uniref:P43 5S RNA-binding protein n=1 Tax=Alosa sapidissima TaxID=34773 RepID=UPI001C08680A|nr:P43 5S RNA-binding protein [Alosa sapidissima]XP_041942361.1 P43 5S RNA-binding protein [Alosa sapidissima]XP_041942362.1 P43 5S RNA-binding protein [Alosa sapidissima]XP_041942364.1 P43 5S RNA-binding protein [Alosa sapidissima]
MMNGVSENKVDPVPRMQLFNCMHADCGATFTRQWRLKEHETTHTGARPVQCKVAGCGRSFSRASHLKHHALQHGGVKKFKCGVTTCGKGFLFSDKLKRHLRCAHGQKDKYFKCNLAGCTMTFLKRRALKLHLNTHGMTSFKCSKDGCLMKFSSHIARKAHERTHAGYTCPKSDCEVTQKTWGKMLKHMAGHQVVLPCPVCKKQFKKRDSLRRHKRTHALQKPVLLCPQQGCQAYFSTTFNLQHHIRKQHLQLLRHHCSFPDCDRAFAMRESLTRHLLHHDPDVARLKRRQRRSSKSWQKRLDGHGQHALVEEDLRGLFALRMRFCRRAKLEANLSGLFNERKVPHRVDPETNLRDLFSLKPPRSVEVSVEDKQG